MMNYRFNICIILNQLFLFTTLRGDNYANTNVSIKLRTVKDLEAWRFLQMQAKQDYFFRKRVMTHSTICEEPIYCEESFMNNEQKSRLLHILNDYRNRVVEKSCNAESAALQLIWFWKAEINATIDSLGCEEGTNTTDVILDGDLDTNKYFHKSGFEIYPGEGNFLSASGKSNHKFPIREHLKCYPKFQKFSLNTSSIEYFLDVLESELQNKTNLSDCITDEMEFKNCLYVGCSLTLTQTDVENITGGYFNCYFCDRTVTLGSQEPSSDCLDGYKKSKMYSNLCQDLEIKNSFIDEQITRQYDCGRLEYVQAHVTDIRMNCLLIIYLILIVLII